MKRGVEYQKVTQSVREYKRYHRKLKGDLDVSRRENHTKFKVRESQQNWSRDAANNTLYLPPPQINPDQTDKQLSHSPEGTPQHLNNHRYSNFS